MPDDLDSGVEEAVTRSFWSGTITFGLVNIPVALYAANRAGGVSLRMVAPDGTPLNRRYFTTKDDKELDSDEIVRGYEIEKDRFVIVDDEELERLAPERTRDIDLRQFVKVEDIDPRYFERAYYLTPAGQSNKAYRLLAQVMEETGRAGVATFVMRTKEYLVAILAENGILRAETLRFADELRTPEFVGLPAPAEPPAAEVKRMDREIGKQLEEHLGRDELKDESKDRMMKVVRDKLRAGEGVVEPGAAAEAPDDIIDLMQILKARLQGRDPDAAPRQAADRDESRSAAKPARKTASKPASKSTKKPAASKTASKSSDKPASKTASKSAARPARKTADKAAKKPASKTASGSAKKPAAKTSARKPAPKSAKK